MTDEQIARAAKIKPITEIAARAGILPEELEPYGKNKAKLSESLYDRVKNNPDGTLVLVTAINPTPAGEGKSTVSVGLADALGRIGERCVLALREPSLGPVFGVKGGAAGGGYAQVVPMDEINLHFTGDIHAVTSANNLLAAMTDNHIYQGNSLGIDPRRVVWRRCMDMNDRQLRSVVSGLGGSTGGMPREDGFDITAASEVMAVFCLASSPDDLRARLARIVVGCSFSGEPVTAGDLKAAGAMAALLKEAFKPNLVQTLEGTPALIHGGPFANIAHGCNSVMATKFALKLGDFVVTEAGFGADLGAEKFLDIKCPSAGLTPSAVVIVATVRALKHHGGAKPDGLKTENLDALKAGIGNLRRHVENITRKFGLPAVVAVNRFVSDTDAELALVRESAGALGVKAVICDVWANGGAGGEELAEAVREAAVSGKNGYKPIYPDGLELRKKIETVVREIYGGAGVDFDPAAKRNLRRLTEAGCGKLPVCMAKTQYSFSDDPRLLGAPEGFTVKVSDVKLSAGAGFVVVYTGSIMTMPGLPKIPSAEAIDITDGEIRGLF